jgi:SlyX protein
MSSQRLNELEEKLAYLEAGNAQLSEEIYRQQQEINVLTKAHQQLLNRISELQALSEKLNGQGLVPLEQPPHY